MNNKEEANMSIDRSEFALECVDAAVYCGVFSYLHYITAAAALRSQVTDENDNNEFGPFRLTQKTWDAYRSDNDFDFNFVSSEINSWKVQCHVFALIVYRARQRLFNLLNRNPSPVELYGDQWAGTQAEALVADLKRALSDTEGLLKPAAQAFFGRDIPVMVFSDPAVSPDVDDNDKINYDKVPNGALGKKLAKQIVTKFKNGGFGTNQQVAALANAIAESGLVPDSHAALGEDSFGLFQLNRRGGLGAGHSPEDLMNPGKNTQLVIRAAENSKAFKRAFSLEDAVSAFVKDVERPPDIFGQTSARILLARSLLG
jgi:hypothetical protein